MPSCHVPVPGLQNENFYLSSLFNSHGKNGEHSTQPRHPFCFKLQPRESSSPSFVREGENVTAYT